MIIRIEEKIKVKHIDKKILNIVINTVMSNCFKIRLIIIYL